MRAAELYAVENSSMSSHSCHGVHHGQTSRLTVLCIHGQRRAAEVFKFEPWIGCANHNGAVVPARRTARHAVIGGPDEGYPITRETDVGQAARLAKQQAL